MSAIFGVKSQDGDQDLCAFLCCKFIIKSFRKNKLGHKHTPANLQWCSPDTRGTGLWRNAAPGWTCPRQTLPARPVWTGIFCSRRGQHHWSALVHLAPPCQQAGQQERRGLTGSERGPEPGSTELRGGWGREWENQREKVRKRRRWPLLDEQT